MGWRGGSGWVQAVWIEERDSRRGWRKDMTVWTDSGDVDGENRVNKDRSVWEQMERVRMCRMEETRRSKTQVRRGQAG